MSLEEWGWDADWAARLDAVPPSRGRPGRVVGQDRARWIVRTADGSVEARRAPGFRLLTTPVVGDWVVVEPGPMPSDPASLSVVLPRRSGLGRGAAGTGATEQLLAANVDVVWIVVALDAPVNVRRIERYLAVAWESGAVPEVVLTKSDLAADLTSARAQARAAAVGVPDRVVSVHDEEAVERLRESLRPGTTVVLLGPSGVGKSMLVNLLDGSVGAATSPVREKDRKGRHTTTRRELFRIRGGALLIDTPGIRELRVWSLDEGLEHVFPEIDELAAACRFRDCRHETEPGCAVLEAEAAGSIDAERLAHYRKLRAEAAYQARKDDPRARRAAVAEHKSALKTVKAHHKFQGPG
jgi:ribosome biogenesis GTPase